MLPTITKVSLSLTVSYPYATVPGHNDVASMYSSEGNPLSASLGTDVDSEIFDIVGTALHEAVTLPTYTEPPDWNIYDRPSDGTEFSETFKGSGGFTF